MQKEDLHADGEEGLDEERRGEVRAEPVEYPVVSVSVFLPVFWSGTSMVGAERRLSYFKILATSIISGMSSEKPAELRVLWME